MLCKFWDFTVFIILVKELIKRAVQVMEIISVGNPNRLVVTVKRERRENSDSGYIFNSLTGEIIYYKEEDKVFDIGVYRITDDEYPLFEGQQYIGYVRDGKFVSPDGILQGCVNKAQEIKIREKREELKNLLCSRFR